MNRRELIAAIAAQSGTEAKVVDAVLRGFTDVVSATVSKGDPVVITGFAKFAKIQTKARMGRNPATGEAIKIKASKKARITPLKGFKDIVLGATPAPKLTKPAPAKAAPARATAARSCEDRDRGAGHEGDEDHPGQGDASGDQGHSGQGAGPQGPGAVDRQAALNSRSPGPGPLLRPVLGLEECVAGGAQAAVRLSGTETPRPVSRAASFSSSR